MSLCRDEQCSNVVSVGGNRWVEYDLPRGAQTLLATGRDSSDTSAIKALLDLQTGAKQQRPK